MEFTAGSFKLKTYQSSMLPSDRLEALEKEVDSKIPDLVFGDSYASFSSGEFVYSFNAADALRLCNFEEQRRRIYTQGELKGDHINVLPVSVKVAHHQHWENKTVPKHGAFHEPGTEHVAPEVVNTKSDWTYCTPYKGSVQGATLLPSHQSIPVHRLGQDNPILWASEVIFYEDELDDNGQSKCHLRVRAMEDCWYALLRSYVRVDHVMVRVLDTRIFHSYGEREVLREFQHREATYEELTKAGFVFSPQWAIDPRQSDMVFEYLNLQASFKDVISF